MQGSKTFIAGVAITFALIITLPNISSATAISVGQPWGEFQWPIQNSIFVGACDASCTPSSGGNSDFLGDPPWTFSGSGFLIVQDAFNSGDQFEVFDDTSSIGQTSAPTLGDFCDDPVVCFGNGNFSKGIFALGAGFHSFEIQPLFPPSFSNGVAFLCIDSGLGECGVGPINGDQPVPEPMSMLLLGLGLAGAFVWVQRPKLSKIRVLIANKLQRR